jgi:hypothetical protein
MQYRHRQTATLFYYLPVVVVVVVAAPLIFATMPFPSALALCAVIVGSAGAAVAMFSRLGIEVDSGRNGDAGLRWAMSFGWPAGRVPIAEIAQAGIVPVTFWMGTGIHFIFRRRWVWNVAFGNGVQIEKRDGSRIILGTNDPEGLLAAIQTARELAATSAIS